MSVSSSSEGYGVVARSLHWLVAALIVVLLASGLLSDLLPKPVNIPFHKALGIVVLGLASLRLVWWAVDRARPHQDGPRWQTLAALGTKIGLAVCSVAMPLSGWLMSSAAGKPIVLFGLATVPPLLSPDKPTAGLLREVHESFANLLIALLILHVGASLYHHYMLKDRVLIRMVPRLDKSRGV